MPRSSRADNLPAVSVIIPFRNAAETLPACLDAVASQDGAPAYEVVAVDNNSTDESVRLVKEFAADHPDLSLRILAETEPGPGAARNCGARTARGRLLLFTDADCLPTHRWIAEMWAHYTETPDIGAISGCIRPHRPRGLVHTFTSLFTLPPHDREEVHDSFRLITGGFQTANLAVPADVFQRSGGFPDGLFPGEDHALCRRIYDLGRKIRAVPDAVVYHWHRATFRKMLRQARGYGRAHAYALRYLVPGACIVLLPWVGGVRKILPGFRVWLDFSQADKKTVVLLAAAAAWPPLAALLPLYWLRLAYNARRRARQLDIPLPLRWAALMPFLMIAKSAAFTLGRVQGALEHRVLCV